MRSRKFLAATMLLAAVGVIGNSHAGVETNWPVGTANVCRSPTDGFIDFESGQDRVVVRSTIPGTQFTTTDGVDWLYADWRTGLYNGPYPRGAYTSNGNFFTWLGPSQGQGRIDFPTGPASYVSVLTSTFSGLVLDAYNKDGALIATSGRVSSNVGTGTLTRVTVESATGKDIAYVMAHDAGNFWLMDDLCTDAAGVPPAYAAVAQTAITAIGAPYTLGAKGYNGGNGGWASADELRQGTYNYYDFATRQYISGKGIDCSGLSLWAYDRTVSPSINWNTCAAEKKCPVFQEGADGQYRFNTNRISAQEVRPGDLLFFDYCKGSAAACTPGQDGVMDHVAMFVGPFSIAGQMYNVVHASGARGQVTPASFDTSAEKLLTRLANGQTQTLQVAKYGRVAESRLDAWIVTKSPVELSVFDPEGGHVSSENALLNDLGHTREVPGMYYMVKELEPGAADDTVAIPQLKPGMYLINVTPKPNAQPSDVFSLEVRLPGNTIALAERVSVEDLTKRTFAFEASPEGVIAGVQATVDIKPGDSLACINPKSKGNTPVAILGSASVDAQAIVGNSIEMGVDSDRSTPGVRPTRWSADSDVNRDGFVDLVLHFSTPALKDAAILEDGKRVFVTGQLTDGRPIAGTDVVYLVGSLNCR